MRIVAVVQCKSDTCIRDYLRSLCVNVDVIRMRSGVDTSLIYDQRSNKCELLCCQIRGCALMRKGDRRASLKAVAKLVAVLSTIISSPSSHPTPRRKPPSQVVFIFILFAVLLPQLP